MTALADLLVRDRRPSIDIGVSVDFAGRRRPIFSMSVKFEPGEPPEDIGRAIDRAFADARAAIAREIEIK